jgi:DNA (cytosine-5)-methyltransferase 1
MANLNQVANNTNLNALSLFSGGGFLDVGFLDQGFSINQAVEINPFFIQAYNSGLKSYIGKSQKKIYQGGGALPFTSIDGPIDASSPAMQKMLKKANAGVTGIIGGPPCQDYSVGGKNAGLTGLRGKLIFSYFEIVKSVKPQFIFFENVAGLYNTKEHRVGFLEMVKKLETEGYVVWYDILNSLQYGIPQDRQRLTLVGFKREIVKTLEKEGFVRKADNLLEGMSNDDLIFKWPQKEFTNPKSIIWPTKWDFGSDVIKKDIIIIPEKYKKLQVINAFEDLKSDTPNHDEHFEPKSQRFKTIEEGDTNRKSFKRLHRFRYSPTVAYGNNEVHLHPTEPRRLTVREALRLQSVPDNYILPKDIPLTHKFKLISNGVPVKKSKLIANEIKRTLDLYNSLK